MCNTLDGYNGGRTNNMHNCDPDTYSLVLCTTDLACPHLIFSTVSEYTAECLKFFFLLLSMHQLNMLAVLIIEKTTSKLYLFFTNSNDTKHGPVYHLVK